MVGMRKRPFRNHLSNGPCEAVGTGDQTARHELRAILGDPSAGTGGLRAVIQETTADAFGLPVFHRGTSPAVPRDATGTSKHFLKGFQKFGPLRRGAPGPRSRRRPWWLPPCWKVGEHNIGRADGAPVSVDAY